MSNQGLWIGVFLLGVTVGSCGDHTGDPIKLNQRDLTAESNGSTVIAAGDKQSADTIRVGAEDASEIVEENFEVIVKQQAQVRIVPYSSCQEILDENPESPSGNYMIRIKNASGVETDVNATCDMTTANGGWTLVMNYVHVGGTNPPTVVRNEDFPIMMGDTLGLDESGQAEAWGHASNAMLTQFEFTQARFYCRTNEHDRLLDFHTDLATCIDYLKRGAGTCLGVNNQFTPIGNHNAVTPAGMNDAQPNRGNMLFLDDPFQRTGENHWSVGFGDFNDWECDNDPDNMDFSTIHRLWIR